MSGFLSHTPTPSFPQQQTPIWLSQLEVEWMSGPARARTECRTRLRGSGLTDPILRQLCRNCACDTVTVIRSPESNNRPEIR
eukprot:749798-Hanusia_phi.AAC.10